MRRIISTLFLLLGLGLMFWSCERSQYPTDTTSSANGALRHTAIAGNPVTPSSVDFPLSVVLSGFTVTFNGRTFDLPLMELSAFRYGLSVPGWFNVESKSWEQNRSRYNLDAHFDLHDVLTNFGATRFSGGLNTTCTCKTERGHQALPQAIPCDAAQESAPIPLCG